MHTGDMVGSVLMGERWSRRVTVLPGSNQGMTVLPGRGEGTRESDSYKSCGRMCPVVGELGRGRRMLLVADLLLVEQEDGRSSRKEQGQ